MPRTPQSPVKLRLPLRNTALGVQRLKSINYPHEIADGLICTLPNVPLTEFGSVPLGFSTANGVGMIVPDNIIWRTFVQFVEFYRDMVSELALTVRNTPP